MALGFRGDLWVVGAQNAGKSSLISAMKRLAGTAGKGEGGQGAGVRGPRLCGAPACVNARIRQCTSTQAPCSDESCLCIAGTPC